AEGRSRVALNENSIADGVCASKLGAERALQVQNRIVPADMQRLDIGLDQLVFAFVLFANELLHDLYFHVEEGGKHADINDVLEQLALARVCIFAITDGGKRHADNRDVIPEFRWGHRLGRVVEQKSARFDASDIPVKGLRVHRDHKVRSAACTEMARFRN